MRPTHFRVEEAEEYAGGAMAARAVLDGKVWMLLFSRAALENRKETYGLHSDEDAFRALVAEHMDRWEDTGFDWRADRGSPPGRLKGQGRPMLEIRGQHALQARAPEIREVHEE